MLQITLGEKTYKVDYVSALALREIRRPMEILNRPDEEAEKADWAKDLDILVRWFCLMFGNQFSADEVYTLYPSDRLIPDIALAVMAVEQRISAALTKFPTKPAAEEMKRAAT